LNARNCNPFGQKIVSVIRRNKQEAGSNVRQMITLLLLLLLLLLRVDIAGRRLES
jgi:hypothetical protein